MRKTGQKVLSRGTFLSYGNSCKRNLVAIMMVFISYSLLNYRLPVKPCHTFACRWNFSKSGPQLPSNSGECGTKTWASLLCWCRQQENFLSNLMWFYWIWLEPVQAWADYSLVGLPFYLLFRIGSLIDKEKKWKALSSSSSSLTCIIVHQGLPK